MQLAEVGLGYPGLRLDELQPAVAQHYDLLDRQIGLEQDSVLFATLTFRFLFLPAQCFGGKFLGRLASLDRTDPDALAVEDFFGLVGIFCGDVITVVNQTVFIHPLIYLRSQRSGGKQHAQCRDTEFADAHTH